MKNVSFSFALLAIAAVGIAVPSAVAQAPQTTNHIGRPTAAQLFDRENIPMPRVARNGPKLSADAQYPGPAAPMPCNGVLRTGGLVNSSPTVVVYFDSRCGVSYPVFVMARIFSGQPGNLSDRGSIYVPRNLSLTSGGPGYFRSIEPGAWLPVAELMAGNSGDLTVVQVAFVDASGAGRQPVTLETSFYQEAAGIEEIVSPSIKGATIMSDGISGGVIGTFPVNQPLLVEIGNPQMDVGWTITSSADGKTLRFPLPNDANGDPIWPAQWPTVTAFTVTVMTADGVSSSAPLGLVAGNSSTSTINSLK
jgi:hypothetical protein